jgi:hypothetical protein
MPDTSAQPHTYEDMTSFDETLHPRAATGTFTEKAQSAPEFGCLATDIFLAESGDTILYSHADGDFDALDAGWEGFEVTRNDDGTFTALAYTDVDFHHLARLEPAAATDPEGWLNENRNAIERAVTVTFPGLRLDDRYGDWETQALTFDLTSDDRSTAPSEPDGLIAAAKADPVAQDLTGPEGLGASGGTQQLFWGRIHSAMVAEKASADQSQEG